MLDKEAIRDAADITIVAEEIGVPIKYGGPKPLILCPCHNDQHFGSCYLKPNNTFKCYSCGAFGDVFTLVQKALNISFAEAVAVVAETCGGTKQFEMSEDEKSEVMERNGMLLSKGDQDFLGLRSEPVYTDIGWRDIGELEEDDERFASEAFDEDGRFIGYRLQKKVSGNPLLDLLKSSPDEYHELIDRYCDKRIKFFRNVISLATAPDLLRPERFFDMEDAPPEVVPVLTESYNHTVAYMQKILQVVSLQEIIEEISALIKRAQDISVRFGAGGAISKDDPADIERLTSLANSIWLQDALAPF